MSIWMVGNFKSPCPKVSCFVCDCLEERRDGYWCKAKKYYVHEPKRVRGCCRWKPKGQTTPPMEGIRI